MRNIISDIIAVLRQSTYNLAMDWRDAFHRHFSFNNGGSMSGLYIKLPFLPLSAWVQWGMPHAGYGTERSSETDLEFFLGTTRGVLSIEKKFEDKYGENEA